MPENNDQPRYTVRIPFYSRPGARFLEGIGASRPTGTVTAEMTEEQYNKALGGQPPMKGALTKPFHAWHGDSATYLAHMVPSDLEGEWYVYRLAEEVAGQHMLEEPGHPYNSAEWGAKSLSEQLEPLSVKAVFAALEVMAQCPDNENEPPTVYRDTAEKYGLEPADFGL